MNVNIDATPVIAHIPDGIWGLAEIFFLFIGVCACARIYRWATAPICRPDKEEHGKPNKHKK